MANVMLRGASLREADMSGAQLDAAELTGADLRKANLRGAGFRDARLDEADLRDARLGSAFLGWPNLRAHCRTVSWLTMMPRAASNSSTMRSPSGKRKYSHTAWPIISAGNRYPA